MTRSVICTTALYFFYLVSALTNACARSSPCENKTEEIRRAPGAESFGDATRQCRESTHAVK